MMHTLDESDWAKVKLVDYNQKMSEVMKVYLTSPILGGLGNQLFIIATLINFGILLPGVTLLLLKNVNQGARSTQWDKFFSDCPKIIKMLCENLPEAKWACYDKPPSDVYIDRIDLIKANQEQGISTINEGYFQNWRYLPSKEDLWKIFNITNKKQKLSHLNLKGTCALHFRLGDYKNYSHWYPLLTDRYYQNALRIILEKNSSIDTITVFNEVEDQEQVEVRIQKIIEGFDIKVQLASKFNLEDYQELIAMSSCSALIIANSTFSWWAAYFSEAGSEVVYPAKWFNGLTTPPSQCLALPGWIEESCV
jgi:midasin (ATPase involved in ribosome maturation)